MLNYEELEATFTNGTKVYKVYRVLRDHQWHCRECEYTHVESTQIAGGAGIQGLQRGNNSRPGLQIESADHFCARCNRRTRHDRWQGAVVTSTQGASMPTNFVKQAIQVLGSRDVIELTERPRGQLTIDHKLPMLRWNPETRDKLTKYSAMLAWDIQEHFQLLKKSNGSVSHNLLKSRACERCFQTGNRGRPFGIEFFYEGGPKWEPADKQDPSGCIGCGWYDFNKWRTTLNAHIRDST